MIFLDHFFSYQPNGTVRASKVIVACNYNGMIHNPLYTLTAYKAVKVTATATDNMYSPAQREQKCFKGKCALGPFCESNLVAKINAHNLKVHHSFICVGFSGFLENGQKNCLIKLQLCTFNLLKLEVHDVLVCLLSRCCLPPHGI